MAPPTLTVTSETIPEMAPTPDPELNLDPRQPPELRYDPEAIARQYRGRPLQVNLRLLFILGQLAWFALGLLWDKFWGRFETNQVRRAIHLRETLTNLGPAFIKIGQALSTRPDLVPPTYLEELTQLQDQLPAFPTVVAFDLIEAELGDRPEALYAELTTQAIAAASLGQVYKGKLQTGATVAVKVQRPGLAESIALDIYILRGLAAWIQRHIQRIRSDLVAILDEFGCRIFEELDYAHEGRNAEHFARLYGHFEDIYIPKIYWRYTSRRVLTMEWVNGTKLTKTEELQAQGLDPTAIVDLGVQCSLRQLLEHGFFHADPHPGNLLATPEGKLAYLDFGMMSEVKTYQRYGLIEAVVHMVNRDFASLAQDYVKLEFLTPGTDLSPIIPALSEVFNDALGASVAEMNFKSITDRLSALMYEYPFQVPAYYALIIRSLVTLEGIAIHVDPNFKVLSKAYPYIAKRLLTDPAPQLRTSLQNLLFRDGDFRWNRLENLLRNARNSDDYDINKVLDQSLEFLSSERGAFVRDYLVDSIVGGMDELGRTAFDRVAQLFYPQPNHSPNAASGHLNPETLERFQRIWGILQETKGFDPFQVAPWLARLLFKPAIHTMGQEIAGGLAQRAVARLVREVLLAIDGTASLSGANGRIANQSQRVSGALPRAVGAMRSA